MNKLIIALLFPFLAFSGFQDNPVWIKAKMPNNVHAGDKFTIEITINKLDLKHFAELKQKLPAGFKAIENKSGAAEFSFSDQMVKFTWLRLPRSPQITISYNIIVDANIKGDFTLPAQFTYIYKNQRGTVNLEHDNIKVYAPGEVFTLTDKKQQPEINFPPKDPVQVQCLRIKPIYSKEHNALVVKLLISRGAIQSAAKIEENIPPGYSASAIDSKKAGFSFENNKVEIIWKKLPKEKNFEISYKLIPNKGNNTIPVINGNFVYLATGSLQNKTIIEVAANKLNKSSDAIDNDDVMDFFNK